MADKGDEKRGERRSLTDDQIVSRRSFGRRTILTLFGSGLVGAGVLALGVRRAEADPLVGDADRYSDVVNPDPTADQDREPPPSDYKDSDTERSADYGDADERTMADTKIQSESPDSDGSLRDPKDSDQSQSADGKDSD